jgi:hypothetical protein
MFLAFITMIIFVNEKVISKKIAIVYFRIVQVLCRNNWYSNMQENNIGSSTLENTAGTQENDMLTLDNKVAGAQEKKHCY